MVLVTAVAVIALTIPLGILAARLYRGREVSSLERVATRVVGSAPADGETGPVTLPRAPSGVTVALYDAGGRRIAGQGPSSPSSEVRSALSGRISNDHDGGTLAVAIPVQRGGQVVGAARAATAWDVVADDTYESWLAMAAFAFVAVAVAAALAWWQ